MTEAPIIHIRPAEEKDCRFFYDIRNSPEVRALSLDLEEIPYEQHEQWYRKALADTNSAFYIIVGTNEGRKLGYVRFKIDGTTAEISIALSAECRGKGIGTRSIRLACATVFANYHIISIIAQIKEGNIGSMKSFIKAGFSLVTRGDPNKLIIYSEKATYDVGVILSQELDEQGNLNEESRLRMDKGIELFKQNRVTKLIVSGGYCYKEFQESLATVMQSYAIQQGVPVEQIIKEESSLDTVGQIIFCKEVIEKTKVHSIAVISSNYHIPRVRTIIKKVFDKSWHVDYYGIQTLKEFNEETIRKENASEEVFLDMFRDVQQGDTEASKKILKKAHQRYKQQ